MLTKKEAQDLADKFWRSQGMLEEASGKDALVDLLMQVSDERPGTMPDAASIPIMNKLREAPMSPRFELHTACCHKFVSADDDLSKLRSNAGKYGHDLSKLVIYDLGPKRA